MRVAEKVVHNTKLQKIGTISETLSDDEYVSVAPKIRQHISVISKAHLWGAGYCANRLSGTLRKRLIPRSENSERATKGRHHRVQQGSQLSVRP
ncbi:hypothetical protein V3C99_013591 [Haemonchus contortus]